LHRANAYRAPRKHWGLAIAIAETGYTDEDLNSHHRISENASETTPARLLAVFVADERDNLTKFDEEACGGTAMKPVT
jgi:hypothetical protein